MLAAVNITSNSSTALTQVGDKYEKGDGRVFRYIKAGSSNLSRGKLVVAGDTVANHINLSFATAPAVGDKTVYVTLGGTALTADQYKDGWLNVQDGTGEGRLYGIEGNEAQTSTTGTATIFLKEAIDTAGALSEANVNLEANKYAGAVISATDQNDIPLGVPIVAITANYYGWIQTQGPCAVLQDATTPPIGDNVTISAATAGAVGVADADTEPIVGVQGPNTGVSAEYQTVQLKLE